MKIIRMKNKEKIIFEYSTKTTFNFDRGDAKELNFKIFLKNGKTIYASEIESITINAKKEIEQ